jgi:hypothetical protein
MQPSLSFEQAPPISVPFRFFLAAPWFGVLAGVLLTWSGADALQSRWMPQVLALTHLIALGFLLQAMCGAVFQFIPVAVGANVWRPALMAGLVQPLLLLGTLLLAAGLLRGDPDLMAAGTPFLLAGVGIFAIALTLALWRTPASSMTLWALRMAIAGLVVATLLGAVLVEAIAHGLAVPVMDLTDVHLAWGLGGWALMLLAGVSYHVVPMFQLTRPYPSWFTRWFGPALLLLLLAWSSQLFFDDARWTLTPGLAVLMLISAYAAITLRLQQTRQRLVHDATSRSFQFAMACLLAFTASAAACLVFPQLGADPRVAIWLGALALPGVLVSVVTGMLYKIVPFLNWLHLQRLGAPLTAVPNMKQMIPAGYVNGQVRAHMLAVLLLLAAVWLPDMTRPAGVALTASFAWLGWNLLNAVRRYEHLRKKLTVAGR